MARRGRWQSRNWEECRSRPRSARSRRSSSAACSSAGGFAQRRSQNPSAASPFDCPASSAPSPASRAAPPAAPSPRPLAAPAPRSSGAAAWCGSSPGRASKSTSAAEVAAHPRTPLKGLIPPLGVGHECHGCRCLGELARPPLLEAVSSSWAASTSPRPSRRASGRSIWTRSRELGHCFRPLAGSSRTQQPQLAAALSMCSGA
mmetsp:Transcript_165438/g.530837  ORF Transcript_165438/g.530837 Transcript_165438/m.530837 type:complete len:203 (-) Transcript_165438:616-1224(-)